MDLDINEISARDHDQKSWDITKFSGGTVALITVIVFVGIMIYSAQTLMPQLENPQFVVKEESIKKSTKLQLKDGEIYKYSYKAGNASTNLSYAIADGGSCKWVNLIEGNALVCINEHGNDLNGSNSSYSVPAIILMKPWMLAVNENWAWNVSSYMIFDNIEHHIADTEYSVVRKEYYKGREAFVVKIQSTDGNEIWDWVDSEKRILLREVGLKYEVELIEGLKME